MVGTHAGFFLGSSKSAVKNSRVKRSNSGFLEQQLNLRGVSLCPVFFAFGIKKNQVSSNHERHFGRFYNDNSGSSYCVYDFWAKKNCFRPQFFVLSHDPTFKCLYFFLWWEPTANKKSPTLSSFKGNKRPSTGSANN